MQWTIDINGFITRAFDRYKNHGTFLSRETKLVKILLRIRYPYFASFCREIRRGR